MKLHWLHWVAAFVLIISLIAQQINEDIYWTQPKVIGGLAFIIGLLFFIFLWKDGSDRIYNEEADKCWDDILQRVEKLEKK